MELVLYFVLRKTVQYIAGGFSSIFLLILNVYYFKLSI